MSDYPLGTRVRYTARREVAQDEAGPVTAVGFVNGEAYLDDDGNVEYVPVYTKRDRGREATTIVVHVSNIIKLGATAMTDYPIPVCTCGHIVDEHVPAAEDDLRPCGNNWCDCQEYTQDVDREA